MLRVCCSPRAAGTLAGATVDRLLPRVWLRPFARVPLHMLWVGEWRRLAVQVLACCERALGALLASDGARRRGGHAREERGQSEAFCDGGRVGHDHAQMRGEARVDLQQANELLVRAVVRGGGICSRVLCDMSEKE